MLAIVRGALRFAAVEVLIFTAGMMLLPRPTTLLLVSYVAALFIAWDELARLPWLARKRVFRLPAPLVVAMGLVLVPGSFAWGSLERALWGTGSFGEPPTNRYVAGRRISATAIVLEFGAHKLPIDGLEIAVKIVGGYDPGRVSDWFGAPRQMHVLPEEERVRRRLPPLTTFHWNDPDLWHVRSDAVRITSSMSLYVLFESDKPISLEGCVFNSGRDVDEKRCGVEVELSDVTPRQPQLRALNGE